MNEAMNDNERRVRTTESHPTIDAASSIGCDFNQARLPSFNQPAGPVLRRQIDTWLNEGGADEKKS